MRINNKRQGRLAANAGTATSAADAEPDPDHEPSQPSQTSSAPRSPPGRRSKRVLRQIWWTSVPIWSIGLLSFVPFLAFAVIQRRKKDWAVFAAYLVATIAMIVTSGMVNSNSNASGAVGGFIIALAGCAAIHAYVLFRPSRSLSWLRRDGTRYAFGDDALRSRLAVGCAAEASERAQRLARPGARTSVLGALSRPKIRRISWDFAAGAGIALAILVAIAPGPGAGFGSSLGAFAGYAAIAVVAALFIVGPVRWLLSRIAAITRWSRRRVPLSSQSSRLGTGTLAAVIAVALVVDAGRALALLLATVLPAALVAACGG
jgi:hypothetical protein